MPAHDNPGWVFPTLDDAAPELDAADLGHPLLANGVRVDNDVTVGPAGTFLLVTGSNMSGKSTLLRAIGVNLVLAGAGAPVCATRFRRRPCGSGRACAFRIRWSGACPTSWRNWSG